MNPQDITHIQLLIERFYDALISPEEESLLVDLLSHPDLPEVFYSDREVILSLIEVRPPADLNRRLSEMIDTMALRDAPSRRPKMLTHFIRFAAAAVVVIAVALFSFLRPGLAPEEPQAMSSEEIYGLAEQALLTFSVSLNAGFDIVNESNDLTSVIMANVNGTTNDSKFPQ